MPAQHWIVSGQTPVEPSSVDDDPGPNTLPGTTGECQALPFDVPEGYNLVLRAWGIEGTKTPNCALFPWVGENFPAGTTTLGQKSAWRLPRSLYTAQSNGGSKAHGEAMYILPAGKRLHGTLTNGTLALTTLAWFMRGYLVPDTEDPLETIRGLP